MRQVPVGVFVVGEEAAEHGHGTAEPHRVPGAHDRVAGHGGVDGREPPTLTQHARALGEHDAQRHEVAQREPAHDAVERTVGEREHGAVGARQRRGRVRGREHPGGEVDADRVDVDAREVVAQVAGAAREVEHARPGRERERADRPPAPPAVEAE